MDGSNMEPERLTAEGANLYIGQTGYPVSNPDDLMGSCKKIGKEHYLLKLGCKDVIVHNAKEAGKALEKEFKEYFEKEKK